MKGSQKSKLEEYGDALAQKHAQEKAAKKGQQSSPYQPTKTLEQRAQDQAALNLAEKEKRKADELKKAKDAADAKAAQEAADAKMRAEVQAKLNQRLQARVRSGSDPADKGATRIQHSPPSGQSGRNPFLPPHSPDSAKVSKMFPSATKSPQQSTRKPLTLNPQPTQQTGSPPQQTRSPQTKSRRPAAVPVNIDMRKVEQIGGEPNAQDGSEAHRDNYDQQAAEAAQRGPRRGGSSHR